MANYEWESITLGQNKKIQELVSTAAEASELLTSNVEFAKSGLQLAQAFLTGFLNPKVILLNAIADQIDNFVSDFRNAGIYVLEVVGDENYTIPKDKNGNPIFLALSGPTLLLNQTSAIAGGFGSSFNEWITNQTNLTPPLTASNVPATVNVPVGKSLPSSDREDNANDDTLATKDPVTGLYKMTPSQVIATMIAAIDDELDDRRPQFSDDAQVGAIVVIIGFSEFSSNLPTISDVLTKFVGFFGGDDGLFTKGFQKFAKLIATSLGAVQSSQDKEVQLLVSDICGVRGTNDDEKFLKDLGLPYNYSKQFEVGDFVVGPRAKLGARAMGYVSEIVDTIPDAEEPEIYNSQLIKITALTNLDVLAFRHLAAGAKIQKVHYFQNQRTHIDQNSGKIVTGPLYNDYKFFEDLTAEEATQAQTKVTLESGNTLLTVTGTENVVQVYDVGGVIFATRNTVCGTIAERKDKEEAPPPNFKSAKFEDLLGDFKTFFSAIDVFTNTLRNIAKDSNSALDDFIEYLDGKIKELEEINEALQSILKLFNVGLPQGGIYVLKIPPTTGGNKMIKSAMQGSGNAPPDDLDFAVGFLMMGDKTSIELLQDLLVP